MDALDDIFLAARALADPAERAAYLAQACGLDAALRERVEAMLRDAAQADAFFDGSENRLAPTVAAPVIEKAGDRIGRYKLREKIGEGGCGVVYVAEQEEPVRRRVALKVIRLGMDTKSVVARFEAERQALAMMDHPNIAKVLDAGATETGRPYFVMELVRGIKITDYCDQNQVSTRERLDLFIRVCQAVQHAHQKGIIHRDLKPSNILVTLHDGVPVPKVIDFGIAKATEGRLTDLTVYTELHQFLGTPAYMSPEQAEMSGLDIDTRSDIYSLGVLLYELLTGQTPFDAQELLAAGLDEMRRTIRDKVPVRPSTRLTQLQAAQQAAATSQSKIKNQKSKIEPDLDWIVMKALEKDRTRRYEAANGLALDIERHLKHEPVVARPPSAAYRLQKFVRRNKVVVSAGGAVAAALVLGVLVSSWQAVRARRERVQAEANEWKALQAQANEATQRQAAQRAQRQAEAEKLLARQQAYAADINLAQQALREDDLGKARTLLDRYRPGSGQEDLRGFEWRCLAAEAQSDYAAINTSSANAVFRLALSPDGQRLAVGRHFGGIELWDAVSVKRLATLETNAELSVGVAFSPKGRLLAAGAPGGGIRLWQLEPLRVVGELADTNFANRLAFSPDGRHLAAYHLAAYHLGSDVCVWDLENRKIVRRYRDLPLAVDNYGGGPICFSPAGGHLAVGDGFGHIRIMDWAANSVVLDIPAHGQMVTSLAYSPDGKLLASGGGYSPGPIQLWDSATGQSAGSLTGHRSWIAVLQFSGDGHWLLSGSGDQTIGIWDVPGRQLIRKLRGHLDQVYGLALDAHGTNLFTGCTDGALARWEIDRARPRIFSLALPPPARGPRWPRWPGYAAGGSSIAVLDQGAVALWHPGDPQPLSVIAALGTNNATLATACARGLLACAPHDGPVQIWSLPAGSLLTNLGEHPSPLHKLTFSKNQSVLVAGSLSGEITVWDAKTWAKRASFVETNGPSSGAVSPDGCWLVLGLGDGRLAWWDAVQGQRLDEIVWHRDAIEGLDFSPDGTTLASASVDGTAALWDTKTRRRLASFWRAGLFGLHAVAFSPDGTRLVTGLTGGYAACIWDVRTGRELLTLQAPGNKFYFVEFSPSGDALLCGSDDGHAYLWRPPSFAEWDAAHSTVNSSHGHQR